MIPEAEHLDALVCQKLIPLFVSGPLIGKAMSTAVEFDNQLRERAVEIEKVDPARILAAEFELSKATVAEQTPQAFLGVAGFLSEVAGEVVSGCSASAVFVG